MPTLSVAVFGCVTVPKYAAQIESCRSTWICDALARPKADVTVRIFVGEAHGSADPLLVPLHCGDGYDSCTPKHWLGLKHMLDTFNTDFYFVCGTDTFLNVRNAMALLETLDASKSVYVGGHGDFRSWRGMTFYYHSGGPGYIFSRAALVRIFKDTSATEVAVPFMRESSGHPITFCDVQAGWEAQKNCLEVIKMDDKFFHCNHRGETCCPGKPNPKTLIACHQMTAQDFCEYHSFLS